MVQDVGELHRQRHAHPFSELHLFRQSGVKVPLRHTAQVVDAAAACVVTQNAAPEVIVERCRVVKHIEIKRSDGPDAIRSGTSPNQMRVIVEVGING